MNESTDILMQVIRFGLGCTVQMPKTLSSEQAKNAYRIAKNHNIAQIFCYTIVQNQLTSDEQILAEYKSEYFTAILRDRVIQQALTNICELLENENIPYMPLKGAVIRDYYPESWMRSSRDIDILVKPNDHERVCKLLCEKLDYKIDHALCYDTVFNTTSGICVEIHHSLADGINLSEADRPLSNVWNNAYRNNDSKYRYYMDNDLFWYYFIYHTAKHFICGGCGIRALIDFWILNHKFPQKSKSLFNLLNNYNLRKFAQQIENLCDICFLGYPHNDKSYELQAYIVKGGQEGNQKVRNITRPFKKKSKIKYYFSKLFIPFNDLRLRYPILEKWAILAPICATHRLFSLSFGKRKDIRIAKQTDFNNKQNKEKAIYIESTTKEKVDEYNSVLNIVGF